MARKHSGEIVTRTIRQRQKNGDIYVIERKTQYDPEKKYNVVLSSKIVGKIPLGQNQVVRKCTPSQGQFEFLGLPSAGYSDII